MPERALDQEQVSDLGVGSVVAAAGVPCFSPIGPLPGRPCANEEAPVAKETAGAEALSAATPCLNPGSPEPRSGRRGQRRRPGRGRQPPAATSAILPAHRGSDPHTAR